MSGEAPAIVQQLRQPDDRRQSNGRRSSDSQSMPAWFRAWADETKETIRAQKLHAERTGSAGTGRWWAALPQGLRCYILSSVEPDEWDRYVDAPWSGIPEPLRVAIGLQCKAIKRALGDWSWY